ncbi:MAG: acyl-CoA dehydrogenase family protein [Thermodesulfobacteriota bacterium]
MISFEPTEEQALVRDTAREFAAEVLRTRARDADEESAAPADVLRAAWELGLIASQVPESCGGGGAPRSPLTGALLLEELGAGDAGLALATLAPALFAMTLVEQASVKQQQRFLPQLCGRDFHVASVALVEPQPAFDPLALATTAEPRGDGFLLRGRKSFVPFAADASHFLVVARGADEPRGGFAGACAFVVPRDASGLTVTAAEPTLGLRAVPFAGLELDGVEVPHEDRIGGPRGFDYARLLATSRTALAATLVGLSRAVLEYAIPYAKERVAFGEAIARKQAIAFMLSDMAIETDAMRWMVWKAASELEQGRDATRAAHLARSYVAEQAMKIADNGIQVLGGHGFIREHPVEMWYRHARTLGVLEGTAAV